MSNSDEQSFQRAPARRAVVQAGAAPGVLVAQAEIGAELAAMDVISTLSDAGASVVHPKDMSIGCSVPQMREHLHVSRHAGFYEWLMAEDMHHLSTLDISDEDLQLGPWLNKAILTSALTIYLRGDKFGMESASRSAVENNMAPQTEAELTGPVQGMPMHSGGQQSSVDPPSSVQGAIASHAESRQSSEGQQAAVGSAATPENLMERLYKTPREQLVSEVLAMPVAARASIIASLSPEDRSASLMAMTTQQRRETIGAMPQPVLNKILTPRRGI